MSLSLPDIFTGDQSHHFEPQVDLLSFPGDPEGQYRIMLTAIPRGTKQREVFGTVGEVDLNTGKIRLLQPSVPEDRLPVPGNIRPDAKDVLEGTRAWIAAAVQEKVVANGYQTFGDFFGPRN